MNEIPMLRLANGREIVFYTEEYVEARLQDAGCTIMMTPGTGTYPAKIKSCMPDVLRDYWESYGNSDPEPARIRPTMGQITRMEEVLRWLMIHNADLGRGIHARVLAYRMLTWPDSGRARYSWRHIATKLHTSKTSAERFHGEAIRRLTHALNRMEQVTPDMAFTAALTAFKDMVPSDQK